MAFDFPASPAVGDKFTPQTGLTFTWNGEAWLRTTTNAGNFAMPAGCIMPFAGDTAPAGALMCFGQEYNRGTHAALFAVIGTKYGAGNGTTTANLPDLRGRTVLGRDAAGGTSGALANRVSNTGIGNPGIDSKVLGAAGGVDRTTLILAQTPAHTHDGSGTTSGENVGHTHSGTTGGESADHAHLVNLNTGNDAPDHTHWVAGATDTHAGHQHGFLVMGANGTKSIASGSAVSRNNEAGTTDVGGAHAHNMAFSSGGASARHIHGVYGWTGGINVGHVHGFTTGDRSAGHTHSYSFTTTSKGSGEAHPIVPPAIVLNYIIFTGAAA